MKKGSLIIGGTKGLGLELTRESSLRGLRTWSVGRSANDLTQAITNSPGDFREVGAVIGGDVTKPDALLHACSPFLLEITYLFLVAGNFSRKPFHEVTPDEIDSLYNTHLIGPRKFLHAFHNLARHDRYLDPTLTGVSGRPYHLVVIGSTSSWRMRENESLYAEVQAAKAHFARQFSIELAHDLPGSKTTLICPAGIATNLFAGTGVDTSKFMNPRVVAKITWDLVQHQASQFQEVHILRTDTGEPIVHFGQKRPETPNFGIPRPPKKVAPPVVLAQGAEMPREAAELKEKHSLEEKKVDQPKIDTKDFGC